MHEKRTKKRLPPGAKTSIKKKMREDCRRKRKKTGKGERKKRESRTKRIRNEGGEKKPPWAKPKNPQFQRKGHFGWRETHGGKGNLLETTYLPPEGSRKADQGKNKDAYLPGGSRGVVNWGGKGKEVHPQPASKRGPLPRSEDWSGQRTKATKVRNRLGETNPKVRNAHHLGKEGDPRGLKASGRKRCGQKQKKNVLRKKKKKPIGKRESARFTKRFPRRTRAFKGKAWKTRKAPKLWRNTQSCPPGTRKEVAQKT